MNKPSVAPIPWWKDAAMQLTAGGSAGFIEICMMHPLDVVKTRFQVQKKNANYTSILDCFQKTIRNEGFMAIYKGIVPPIFAETPKRYKKLFAFGSPTQTSYSLALAGLCAGLTEAFIVNPFEVVKVRLQTDQQHFSKQTSTLELAKHIHKEGGLGLNGLNKGLSSTLCRNGIWNMIYFAGSIASTVNIPWDVAKSRIQTFSTDNKYKTCVQTINLVYKEEGFKALFKGLAPKLIRYGPGGAIMILAYEEIYAYLKN